MEQEDPPANPKRRVIRAVEEEGFPSNAFHPVQIHMSESVRLQPVIHEVLARHHHVGD
jgi:hypothetical protein